jgi:mannose-6-phosphate isomerase-like protein (cupin superfamily)
MKRLLWIPLALAALVAALAQAPGGIKMWKSADLKAYGPKLAAKTDAGGLASETLTTINGNNFLIVYRNANGEAEWHEGSGDFTLIQSGVATFVLGGTVKNGRTTAPGEVRGPAIEGGQSYEVAAGDIINVPPKTPHQMLVPKGGHVVYMVLKRAAK